ncbi:MULTISPECIES: ABC transporter ATP-binding protein [Haloferax]|uniref:ATP-binding cassette domain-containing protein n=1 Tax=Haloferax marinum TaxID=2666143 RepID=A0A6A8G801_9EURY|nr:MULTISPECIES: ABC transporter ATP-binding protein [Haloferax]KAB1197826.1 ABC transporter ATP-binding protein [Haloferax sp. CBA1150]MRW96885.1 ATP-binding cassette domain-containing protein [Haloferax marinum]
MTEPLLEFRDVTIQYQTNRGPVTAVSGASFSIEPGEFSGLVGESGSGKSTLVKSVIGGLDSNGEVTAGKILYKGEEIQDYTEEELNEKIRWKEISYIPQSSMNSLDPLQRVSEQAVEIASVHSDLSKSEALERFKELFEIVGLSPDRIDDYPHQFSGGMQQRAITALALFLDPALIIADEPTTALDVIMQDQIFKYLDRVKANTDTSMLLITHDISVVFESCEQIAVLHGGQVCESGSVEDIYRNPTHPYSILLQRAFPDIRYPDRKLEIIEGHPPEQLGEVTECSFVERCPWAVDACYENAPPLENVSESEQNHQSACFRNDETHALKGELTELAGLTDGGEPNE